MQKWIRTLYSQQRTFEQLKRGEHIFFHDMDKSPMFDDAVFPFALPVQHPKHLRLHDCLRVDLGSGAERGDMVAALRTTVLRLEKLDGSKTEAEVEVAAPLLVFPCGVSLPGSPPRAFDLIEFPFEMELEPAFRVFHIVVAFTEDIHLKRPIDLSLSLDAYEKASD